MMNKKTKILIIEKSTIIQKGLHIILFEKNNTTLSVDQCDGSCEWQLVLPKITPNILIASPHFFEKNKKQIDLLKQKQDLQIVGLIYAYHHPDNLTNFDALIHLTDTPEKIKSTITSIQDSSPSSTPTTSNDTLSERETEVLKWIANGYSTKKIANTLFISTHTVNAHRKNIMRKLDIKTISGLTIYAVLNNIISLEEV